VAGRLGDHPVDVMLLATDLGVARRFYGGLRPRAETSGLQCLANRRLRLGEHAMAVDVDQGAAEVAAGEQERLASQREDQGGSVDEAVFVSRPGREPASGDGGAAPESSAVRY
jgi:hypothetical protein